VYVIEAAHEDLHQPRVWDLDTRLPFPCPLADYAALTLLPVAPQHSRCADRLMFAFQRGTIREASAAAAGTVAGLHIRTGSDTFPLHPLRPSLPP